MASFNTAMKSGGLGDVWPATTGRRLLPKNACWNYWFWILFFAHNIFSILTFFLISVRQKFWKNELSFKKINKFVPAEDDFINWSVASMVFWGVGKRTLLLIVTPWIEGHTNNLIFMTVMENPWLLLHDMARSMNIRDQTHEVQTHCVRSRSSRPSWSQNIWEKKVCWPFLGLLGQLVFCFT